MHKTNFLLCIPTRGTKVPSHSDWIHEVAAVLWKRTQLRAGQYRYAYVKPERLQRAIDDDVEWLKAHPSRKSITASRQSKKRRSMISDAPAPIAPEAQPAEIVHTPPAARPVNAARGYGPAFPFVTPQSQSHVNLREQTEIEPTAAGHCGVYYLPGLDHKAPTMRPNKPSNADVNKGVNKQHGGLTTWSRISNRYRSTPCYLSKKLPPLAAQISRHLSLSFDQSGKELSG